MQPTSARKAPALAQGDELTADAQREPYDDLLAFIGRPTPTCPWDIYPLSGRVEVVFQHLKVRQPFDDPTVREEFRQVCNRIPGVNLPTAKLGLRPQPEPTQPREPPSIGS